MKTNLKDIASPTTAFTGQFLEDTAITNTDDLARYMLSTEYDFGEEAGGQNRLIANTRPLRMRGIAGGTLTMNFFKSNYRTDAFNLERIDQSRGPNSVLFGIGDPGGIINVSTKRALLGQTQGSVVVQAKSHESLRGEFDFNQPVLRGRLAVRVAGVDDRTNTWRNYEHADERRAFATIKWRIAPRTELNIDLEDADIDKTTKRTYTALDGYTLWRDAGRNLSATANPALGIAPIAGANVSWIVLDTATGALTNLRNTTTSTSRNASTGGAVALTDFSVLPRETSTYGPGFYQVTNYSRIAAYLTHTFGRDLNIEVAAMRTIAHSDNTDPFDVTGQTLRADTQPTLPNPAGVDTPLRANPNAGRAYFDYVATRNINDDRDDSIRTVLAWRKELGRWGTHTLAGVGQYNFSRVDRQSLGERFVSPNAPNTLSPDSPQNRVFRRTYVDLDGPSEAIVVADPRQHEVSGVREPVLDRVYTTAFVPFNQNTQIVSNDGVTLIGMLQSGFWRDRLHAVLGASRDERTDYTSTQGRTPVAGFQQGVPFPIRSHDGDDSKASSFSFSGVFHVTKWLSLTYSRAENSALPSFNGRLNQPAGGLLRPPTPRGESEDIGFKLDLWDRRLFLTAEYFETAATNDFDFAGATPAITNRVWNALDSAGVLAANGLDRVDVEDISTGATFDARTKGYEMELTANPTENWRVFLNFSSQTTKRTNIGAEQQAYIAFHRDLWLRNSAVTLVDGTGRTVAEGVADIDRSAFNAFVVADGREPLGQLRHKFNLRTNYDFTRETLKGFSVGGGARYSSKPLIGFNATADAEGNVSRATRYGSGQFFFDGNASYRRNFSVFGKAIRWSLQLNVNNVFDNDDYVVLSYAPEGIVTRYRFNPPREWILTSRFSF